MRNFLHYAAYMLERKIVSRLIHWKEHPNHKALLVKGARQVGKTTSIRDFARTHYEHFIEINFEKMPSARHAFDGDLDARTILINLSAMGFGPLVPGKTLIFFDEIQACPAARTAIKFLVEDGRYDYIESGSLLGINYGEVSSFPVGYEHEVQMFPLDFEEFLWASGIGADIISALRESYEQQRPVSSFLHNRIMTCYRQYLVVGGMPEVVTTFLSSSDFSQTLSVQRSIMSGYRNDISKYAGRDKLLAKAVFDAIPGQLSKQNKRFVLAGIEKNTSHRKYGAPTQWLSDAGMAHYCFNMRSFELPFPLNENLRLYKLYMTDTGLLSSMMLRDIQGKVLSGEIDINEGALTENFVACELVCHGHSLNYYDHKSKYELDFILPEDGRITVVEVKSGKEYKRHSSLDIVGRLFNDRIGRRIVLCPGNIERTEDILYLPVYMAMFIS